MKLGDGLFLNTFRKVAEEYKGAGIEHNDMIVDNTYVAVPLLALPQPLISIHSQIHAARGETIAI